MSVSKEDFEQLKKRVENIEKHLHIGESKSTAGEGSPSFEIPGWYTEHKQLVEKNLSKVIDLSKKIAPEVEKCADFIKSVYQDWVDEFLMMAAHCKRPAENSDVQPVTQKAIKIFNDTDAYKDRASPYINYMNVAVEVIRGASWPCVPINPHETVQAMYEAGVFWMDKIRKEAKNTNNSLLKDWCDSLKTFFEELIQFVKSNFKTGIEWNENGITVSEYLSNPDYHHHQSTKSVEVKQEKSSSPPTSKQTTPAPAAPQVKQEPKPTVPSSGSPKCELDTHRNRWNVEYQTTDQSIKIGSMKEEVYLYCCKNSTIHIEGKCKDIITENCENIHVIFDKVISGVEIVHCKKITLKVLSYVPSISVDKTDKYDLHLNEDSLACNIVVSHSTEGNVHYPYNGEDSVQPIPEQYVYNIKGNTLESKVSELYTA